MKKWSKKKQKRKKKPHHREAEKALIRFAHLLPSSTLEQILFPVSPRLSPVRASSSLPLAVSVIFTAPSVLSGVRIPPVPCQLGMCLCWYWCDSNNDLPFPCHFASPVSRSTTSANEQQPLPFSHLCFPLLLEVVFKLNHALCSFPSLPCFLRQPIL